MERVKDKAGYFDAVRKSVFGGAMRQQQVDGQLAILDMWEEEMPQADRRWLAYALATAFHETGFTMQPVHEQGSDAYFFRRYDPYGGRPAIAMQLGNTKRGDGVLFHGRGFVQLTGRRNYALMGKRFGLDLTSDAHAANQALEPKLAARIMLTGMVHGLFTGRRFSSYFNALRTDWVNARRIVNGVDQAKTIADYARKFKAALGVGAGVRVMRQSNYVHIAVR